MLVRMDLVSRGFRKNKKKQNIDNQKSVMLPYNPKKKSTYEKKKRNKSRSNSLKQNYHPSRSKSRTLKISPLNLGKKKLNNSPLKRKSASKSRQLSYRKPLTQRDNEKKSQMISTKIVTQRSPFLDKQAKNSPQNLRKKKQKKHKKLKKRDKKAKETSPEQSAYTERMKFKKNIPNIKTNFSDRKESYFDENLLKQLNIKHAESIKKEEYYNEEFGLTARRKKEEQMTERKNFIDFGTNTIIEQVVSQRDLQSFRKEQQLKWRIMCLELNSIKESKKSEKIVEVIDESEKNLNEVLYESRRIMDYKSLDCYIIQSPNKVRKALRCQRRSSEEKRELVKNHSDQKLLLELENMENFGQMSFVRDDDKQSKQSFCVEFQKQLQESYQVNENPSTIFNKIQYIPQLEITKANQICEEIEKLVFLDFCQELISKQKILHQYLLFLKGGITEERIMSSNEYTIETISRLFQYIINKQYSKIVLSRLNIPFGNSPLTSLKWIRNYFKDVSQSNSEIEETPQPILDSILLNQFDSTNYKIPIESQYFYHHCVYGCVNQLLDTIRPFGIQGKPPLQMMTSLKRNLQIEKVKSKVLEKFQQIVSIRMGRTQFEDNQQNPVFEMQKAFKKMDKLLVEEEQTKWDGNEDILFENKFLLSAALLDHIITEETAMIFRQFL